MNKSIVLNLIGVAVIASPLDWPVKILVCSIAGTPGAIALYNQRRKFFNAQTKLHRLLQQAAEEETKIKNARRSLEADKAEIEQWLNAQKSNIEQQHLLARQKFAAAEELIRTYEFKGKQIIKDAEIASSEIKQAQLAEFQKVQIAGRTKLEEEKLRLSQERRQWYGEKKRIQNEIAVANQQIQQSKNEWESEKSRRRNQLLTEVQRQYDRLMTDLENQRSKLQTEVEITQAQLESDRQLFQNERSLRLGEIEKLQQLWEEKQETEQLQLQQKLESMKDAIFEKVAEEHQEAVQTAIEEAIAPYKVKLQKLQSALETAQVRLILAHERLATFKQPKMPDSVDALSLLAGKLITVYKQRGVYIDFVNVYQNENYIFVVINYCDWHYKEGFDKKSLTKFFDDLMFELKLEERPDVLISPDGYTIKLKPRNFMFLGMIPKNHNEPLVRQFAAELHPDDAITEGDMYLAEDLIAKKMLSFIEPSVSAPKSGDITQIELDWVRYLYEYREQATGRPCITSQGLLLEKIWGVTVGRGTDSELQEDGKTLRQRLQEIMTLLGYPVDKRRRTRDEEG